MNRREIENLILQILFRKMEFTIQDLIKVYPDISKSSIYRHIDNLEEQKFISRIQNKPLIISFEPKIRLLVDLLKKSQLISFNDITKNELFFNINLIKIVDRLREIGIIEYDYSPQGYVFVLLKK